MFVEERRSEAEGVRQGGGRHLVGRRRRGRIRSAAETDSRPRRLHGFVDPDDTARTSSQSQDQVGRRSSVHLPRVLARSARLFVSSRIH